MGPSSSPRAGSLATWAMLIKRVFEVDPLKCPHCGGRMKIISFIERHQQEVIERILRHCGLWEGPIRTLANSRAPPANARRGTIEAMVPAATGDLEFVPDLDFLESQRHEPQPPHSRELQLVLDPEYL